MAVFGQINRILAVPGRRDELLRLVLQGADGMPGCRSYVVAADAGDDDTIWVTEVWESAEHHAASLDLPAVKASMTEAMPLIAGFETVATTSPIIAT